MTDIEMCPGSRTRIVGARPTQTHSTCPVCMSDVIGVRTDGRGNYFRADHARPENDQVRNDPIRSAL